jgi:hypothetical protein
MLTARTLESLTWARAAPADSAAPAAAISVNRTGWIVITAGLMQFQCGDVLQVVLLL